MPIRAPAAAFLAALIFPAPTAAFDGESLDFGPDPFPEGEFRMEPDIDDGPVQQFVQGKPNFVRIADLPPDDGRVALSRMVGQVVRIEDKKVVGSCTGFLVATQLLMTNYHCAADFEQGVPHDPRSLFVLMEHLEKGNLGPKESMSPVMGTIKLD